MRKILFRGKRLDTGEWVEGYYVCEDSMHAIMTVEKDGNSRLLWNEVDPETVGQYTGVQDNECRDIFTGDEVKITNHAVEADVFTDTVSFSHGAFVVGSISLYTFWFVGDRIEVVGNVHDTDIEELLCQKE